MEVTLMNYVRFIALYMILYDADCGHRSTVPLIDCWTTIYAEETGLDELIKFMNSIGFPNFANHVKQILDEKEKSNDNIVVVNGSPLCPHSEFPGCVSCRQSDKHCSEDSQSV